MNRHFIFGRDENEHRSILHIWRFSFPTGELLCFLSPPLVVKLSAAPRAPVRGWRFKNLSRLSPPNPLEAPPERDRNPQTSPPFPLGSRKIETSRYSPLRNERVFLMVCTISFFWKGPSLSSPISWFFARHRSPNPLVFSTRERRAAPLWAEPARGQRRKRPALWYFPSFPLSLSYSRRRVSLAACP